MGALAARSKQCLAKAREDAVGRRLEEDFCNPALGLEGWARTGLSLKGEKRGQLDPIREASRSSQSGGHEGLQPGGVKFMGLPWYFLSLDVGTEHQPVTMLSWH